MARVWFSGAEVAAHRNFLLGQGVDGLALNLGAYLKQRQPIELKDSYEGFDMVLYSSEGGLEAAKVDLFMKANADRFSMIYDIRTDHISHVPCWSGTSVNDFYSVAEHLEKIGVSEVVALDQQLMRFITAFVRKRGIELVVASSKADALQHQWSDVILGGWIASAKHRELQVWDGSVVRRYSKANRQEGAEKHWSQIERLGVNPQDCIDDDQTALQTVAVQSWLLYGRREAKVVAIDALHPVPGIALDGGDGLATTPQQPRSRERIALPVMTREMQPPMAEGGVPVPGAYQLSSRPMRACAGCNLSGHCPSYENGAECAFEIPVRITTKAELEAAKTSLLEMQMHRILFGFFQEELLSQGLDPAQSAEMERFFRMVESMQRASQTTESITVVRKAEAGAMSRLFGASVGEAQTQLRHSIDSNELSVAVLDAEVIDDIPQPPGS